MAGLELYRTTKVWRTYSNHRRPFSHLRKTWVMAKRTVEEKCRIIRFITVWNRIAVSHIGGTTGPKGPMSRRL